MKIYKKFDIVLNAINDWCEKNNVYGLYEIQLILIPELKELKDNGELSRIIDLLIEDGYIAIEHINSNENSPKSYRLTAKGLSLINEGKGFQWRKGIANTVIILAIISTLISFLSLIIQLLDKFHNCHHH